MNTKTIQETPGAARLREITSSKPEVHVTRVATRRRPGKKPQPLYRASYGGLRGWGPSPAEAVADLSMTSIFGELR